MRESFPTNHEGLTQDQLDVYAMGCVSSLLWFSEQSLGESPNLAMFIATAFPDDPTTARVVTQRTLEFISNPEEMEARRTEIFGSMPQE